jgi:sterol desaturase/sphingolipid hydroxylase (fatty acid hydroxylase superfamily)
VDVDYQRNSSARMFYIPIISGLMIWALATGVTTWAMAAAFFALGWMTWDVMEYAIHRYFFHWEGSGPFTRKLHDIVHGYHHQYPDDDKRLVMPLGASIPLAALIGLLLWIPHRPAATLPVFCGIVAAYLFYDFTHYRTPLTAWGRAIRSHHMAHHFADPKHNFGISHRWIDWLLASFKKR